MGDHVSSLQKSTTGSSIFSKLFSLCRGRTPIQSSGHSSFGSRNNLGASVICTWAYAEIASLVSPAISRSFETVSKNFAAAICEAQAPCSVNTALCPSSSLTLSPQSTTRPLYFWRCVASSAFFKWQRSTKLAKWTVCPSFFAWRMTSYFDLTFLASHAGIVNNSPRLWLLVSSKLLERKLARVSSHSVNFPHILFRRCGPSVVASLFRMLLYFLNLTVPHWYQLKLQLPEVFHRLSSLAMHGKARVVSLSSFRRASAPTLKWSVSSVNTSQISLLRRAACSLGRYSAHSAIYYSFCFLENCVQASGHILSGWYYFWIFCKSSIYPLVFFNKPCM